MIFEARLILAMFLILGACQTGPESRGIEVTDDYKIFNQEKTMFVLEYMIEDKYGKSVKDLQFDTKVYWTDTPCPYKEGWAVIKDKVCYNGMMWSCQEMYVAKNMNTPDKTCGTALLHEFGHCIRQELGFPTNGDDHWDDEFWTVVATAAMATCDRSWTAGQIRQEVTKMQNDCQK